MKFHHLGVACENISDMRNYLMDMLNVSNAMASDIVWDPIQEIDLCMISQDDHPLIELISGACVESFVRSGHPLYHVCFSVEHMDASIAVLKEDARNVCVLLPTPAVLFEQKIVSFWYTPIGLIELLEI